MKRNDIGREATTSPGNRRKETQMGSQILFSSFQSFSKPFEVGDLVVFEDYEGKRYGGSIVRILSDGSGANVQGNDWESKYWAQIIPVPFERLWPAI